jgi:hypothetical protein
MKLMEKAKTVRRTTRKAAEEFSIPGSTYQLKKKNI